MAASGGQVANRVGRPPDTLMSVPGWPTLPTHLAGKVGGGVPIEKMPSHLVPPPRENGANGRPGSRTDRRQTDQRGKGQSWKQTQAAKEPVLATGGRVRITCKRNAIHSQ